MAELNNLNVKNDMFVGGDLKVTGQFSSYNMITEKGTKVVQIEESFTLNNMEEPLELYTAPEGFECVNAFTKYIVLTAQYYNPSSQSTPSTAKIKMRFLDVDGTTWIEDETPISLTTLEYPGYYHYSNTATQYEPIRQVFKGIGVSVDTAPEEGTTCTVRIHCEFLVLAEG